MRVAPPFRRTVAALPDIGIAVAYVWVAFDPTARDAGAGVALWRAALLEFFAIHASGFLMVPWLFPEWQPRRRVAFVAGLAGAYTLVLGAASLIIGSWWPVVTFWALTGNRLFDAAVGEAPTGEGFAAGTHAWAGNTTLFVAGASVAALLGGQRVTVLVVAALYFTANAMSEFGNWWWVYRWMGRTRR